MTNKWGKMSTGSSRSFFFLFFMNNHIFIFFFKLLINTWIERGSFTSLFGLFKNFSLSHEFDILKFCTYSTMTCLNFHFKPSGCVFAVSINVEHASSFSTSTICIHVRYFLYTYEYRRTCHRCIFKEHTDNNSNIVKKELP